MKPVYQINKFMKVKELIAKLQEFDAELEAVTMDYDGNKEKGSKIDNKSFSIEVNVRIWHGDNLKKALVIR
jgi:hypothetical protein